MTNFADLRACFNNTSLTREPKNSHSGLLLDAAAAIMRSPISELSPGDRSDFLNSRSTRPCGMTEGLREIWAPALERGLPTFSRCEHRAPRHGLARPVGGSASVALASCRPHDNLKAIASEWVCLECDFFRRI